MPDLKTQLQAGIDSGEIVAADKPKPKKRKGHPSTGELTMRTLRWLVATRLGDVEAGVSWHKPVNTEVGQELLTEIDGRLHDYYGERGPRGPSSVDKSVR